MTAPPGQLEHIEPDYSTAAEAWMVLEMTMAMIRHRDACISIAEEYERRRKAEEQSAQ